MMAMRLISCACVIIDIDDNYNDGHANDTKETTAATAAIASIISPSATMVRILHQLCTVHLENPCLVPECHSATHLPAGRKSVASLPAAVRSCSISLNGAPFIMDDGDTPWPLPSQLTHVKLQSPVGMLPMIRAGAHLVSLDISGWSMQRAKGDPVLPQTQGHFARTLQLCGTSDTFEAEQ